MKPEEIVGQILKEQKRTLALAESCTGGLISSRITDVSGSSGYFMGGVVAYSNEAKESILSVPHDILVANGAVSSETALAMAKGVKKLLDTSLGLAVTGIAGPEGGTKEKPVGLVYIALFSDVASITEKFLFSGNRSEIKEQTYLEALKMVIGTLSRPGP